MKDEGLNREVNQSTSREDISHQNTANLPPDPSHQTNEQRHVNDWECRQQADATLSSPYAVYVNCMQEKGSASPPAISPTADPAGNEKPNLNLGHAQEDTGLQSAARNTGNEKPKIGLTRGNVSAADSGENEKPDSGLAQEIGLGVQNVAGNLGSGVSKIGSALGRPLEAIGRGLQNVFRKIGEDIAKIGSTIGKMFKRLGGTDTRDKDKEKGPSKLVAAPDEIG
jgi:hypothetical protein